MSVLTRKRKKRATLDELHEFANKVREAGGGNPIDALLPSVPQDSTQCLIAKNLNFNCHVDTTRVYGRSYWVMWVEDRVLRDRIARELNKLKVNSTVRLLEEGQYGVVLPDHIGKVASDFDNVMEIDFMHPQDWTEEETQLVREMWPYIDASEKEAYDLADGVINDNGEIII